MKTKNLTFLLVLICLLKVAANGASGELDPTFGTNGQIVAAIANVEAAQDLAIQADGKIVIASAIVSADSYADFAVVRLNSNGTIDTAFGSGGMAAISFDSFSNERASAVAVQPDGKIVVAGSAQQGSPGYDFAVARLNTDGSLDAGFGTGGKVKIPVSAANDFLSDMVLQPDGKIVLVGSGFNQPNSDVAVVRLTATGTLDTEFNGSGKIVVPIGAGAANDFAAAAVLQPDGKIVVAGGDGSDFALLRFNSNGSLDASFDGDGKVTTAVGTQRDEARAVAIQPDGKIIAGGFANSGSGNKAALVRYNSNGSLDTTFDGDGKLIAEIRANDSEVFKSIILQADGRIIAVGTGGDETSRGDFLLARFNPDGSFDTSFGNAGKLVSRVGTGDNAAYTAVAQPDGKIIAAGIAANGANSGFAVARYLTDSTAQQHAKAFDYDGDGRSDLSVYRPSNGTWYLQNSSTGYTGYQFGVSSDRIVPADYDGDGKTDVAVYRDGDWFIQRSSNFSFSSFNFGVASDIPVPADFDGDGRAELAVYRPSEGVWFQLNLATNAVTGYQFGTSEDKPVAADYDGDGKTDLAVYRPSNGVWYLLRSRDGYTGYQFGVASDSPVPADYDGDGKADVAVWRASDATWYILKSNGLSFYSAQFGVSTDVPIPADYDGDGKADIAVYRPQAGDWYQLRTTTNQFTAFQFGQNGDTPTPSAFVR